LAASHQSHKAGAVAGVDGRSANKNLCLSENAFAPSDNKTFIDDVK
jgi:hypothetical protein